jgi:hypothetical protein
MRLNNLLAATAAAAAALTLAAGPALAGNAHFIGSATSASASGASLTVKFKEAGLESGSVETITVSAHLDATYQCVNKGNHNPNDPKKTTVSDNVSQSGEFPAAKNGNVSGSLSLSAPASGGLDCPGGQTETLTVVSWSNISITDADTGASLALAGTFSWGTPID